MASFELLIINKSQSSLEDGVSESNYSRNTRPTHRQFVEDEISGMNQILGYVKLHFACSVRDTNRLINRLIEKLK